MHSRQDPIICFDCVRRRFHPLTLINQPNKPTMSGYGVSVDVLSRTSDGHNSRFTHCTLLQITFFSVDLEIFSLLDLLQIVAKCG